MLSIKRGAALAGAATILIGAMAGCNKGTSDGATSGAMEISGSQPIATVNNQPISQSMFFTELQGYMPSSNPTSAQMPAGPAVLRQMIENMLMEQLADAQKVAPTSEEIDTQYDNYRMIQENQSVAPIEDMLKKHGLTVADLKELKIKPEMAQHKLLAKGLVVSEADMKAYYDTNKNTQFSKPERAHIKRISVATQAEAQSIYDQIKKGKQFEDFAARSLHVDPSNLDGDVPQWIPLDNAQNPSVGPLINAIRSAKDGDVIKPLSLQGEWWLVKLVEKKPKEVFPYDKTKSLVKFIVETQKAQQNAQAMTALQQQVRDAGAKATITVESPLYQSVADSFKMPPAPQVQPSVTSDAPRMVPQTAPGKAPAITAPSAGAPGKAPNITVTPAAPKH